MGNLFQYTKTKGQGWLVEKPEMDKPVLDDGKGIVGYYYQSDYDNAMRIYKSHINSLRRFKYDYPDPGKEMELGKDFELKLFDDGSWQGECIAIKKEDQISIPITQRTYTQDEAREIFAAGANYAFNQFRAPNYYTFFKDRFGIEIK